MSLKFLIFKVPYLVINLSLAILSFVMLIALLGYGIEILRPLYLKVFKVSVLEQDDVHILIRGIILTTVAVAFLIILSLEPVQDFLILQYYKLFGGL